MTKPKSFTDEVLREGLQWWATHDTTSRGATEESERMAVTLARLMTERDEARRVAKLLERLAGEMFSEYSDDEYKAVDRALALPR